MRRPQPPADNYDLIELSISSDGNATFDPPIPVDRFADILVWIPDLASWHKPKFLFVGQERWFALPLEKKP